MSKINMLPMSSIQKLRRFNTPTVANGWEKITGMDNLTCFNKEPLFDFMPETGSLVGYAVNAKIRSADPNIQKEYPNAMADYWTHISRIPGPKIIMMQDLDKPNFGGSFWREVQGTAHKAFGCVGAIVDGAVRDLDEAQAAGFKLIGKTACVSHGYTWPVEWGCDVEICGVKV